MNYIDDDHMSSELMSSVHFSDTHYAAVGRETVKETTTGRWTAEEHQLFLEGLRQHKKQWKLIADLIKTRTVVQIRTHAQKYFQKLLKSNKTDDFEDLFIQELANGSGNKVSVRYMRGPCRLFSNSDISLIVIHGRFS